MKYPEFRTAIDDLTAERQQLDPENGLFVVRAFGCSATESFSFRDAVDGYIGVGKPMIAVLSTPHENPADRVHEVQYTSPYASGLLCVSALAMKSVREGYVSLLTADDNLHDQSAVGYLDGDLNTLVFRGMPTYPEPITELFFGDNPF